MLFFSILTVDAALLSPKVLSHLSELKRMFGVTHLIVSGYFACDLEKATIELVVSVCVLHVLCARDVYTVCAEMFAVFTECLVIRELLWYSPLSSMVKWPSIFDVQCTLQSTTMIKLRTKVLC